jgi:hypothetical protein
MGPLEKSSAEFDVGIEKGVAIWIERERERLKQLIESRIFRRSRSKGKREGKCFARERQGRHKMALF